MTEEQYNRDVKRLEVLMEMEQLSAEQMDEAAVLAKQVEEYESEHFPWVDDE